MAVNRVNPAPTEVAIENTPGADIPISLPDVDHEIMPVDGDYFLEPAAVQAFIDENGGSYSPQAELSPTIITGNVAMVNPPVTMPTVEVKKLKDDAIIPTQGTELSAGYDLYVYEDITIEPGEGALISTQIAFGIPLGWAGQINPRSSVASKHKLRIGARVIDADYRGEIMINMFNDSDHSVDIERGTRIAQILFIPVLCHGLKIVQELDDTARGDGGFGSTGV